MEFETQEHYPIFLKLDNFNCLMVGGGRVAARKLKSLLAAGATPHIVAPTLSTETQKLVQLHNLPWQQRAFVAGDTQAYQIVFAATNNAALNNLVAQEALSHNSLINNATNPDICNFTLPATLSMPPLQIAIGTMGQLPMLSHALKQHLAERISPESIELLNEISLMRRQIIDETGTNEQAKHSAFNEKLKPLLDRFVEQF